MSELTLHEKQTYAAFRAREKAAEEHFFDQAQPFFPLGFSVHYRNPGHWDVMAHQCPGKVAAFLSLSERNRTTAKDGELERAFCIRGEPGDVFVRDERWDPHRPHPREPLRFRNVLIAMMWIAEELMREPATRTEQNRADRASQEERIREDERAEAREDILYLTGERTARDFNEAIDFAIDECDEPGLFLRVWREGGCEEHADELGEWVDFRSYRARLRGDAA